MSKGWLTVLAFLCLSAAVCGEDKAEKNLITKEAQKAIDASLKYLANEQAADGLWGTGRLKGNVAITSLAGLALLSGGARPNEGDDGKAVTKAVNFVLNREDQGTPGFFCQKDGSQGPMYNHGFAVLFLADVHETTKDKEQKAKLKMALERAVKLLVDCQNNEGGWRYQPRRYDADLSVTACQIVALRAARGAGIDVPKATLDKALVYVQRCQDQASGGFRYQHFEVGQPGFARSGAGMTSLYLLGVQDGKMFEKGLEYLHKIDLDNLDAADKGHYSYGHYYAAKAMWYAGDKEWQKWYPRAREDLLKTRKGNAWTSIGCPHYGTAMTLIVLQMPHGHLPSLKR